MKPGAVEVPVNQRLKLPANIYGAATGSLKVKDAGSFHQWMNPLKKRLPLIQAAASY